MPQYADIILSVAMVPPFTYAVAEGVHLSVGMRVRVPVGKNRSAVGIVYRVHETPPAAGAIRLVESVLDAEPVVLATQLRLWTWCSEYYLCTLGEVARNALSAGIREGSYAYPMQLHLRLSPEYHDNIILSELLDSMARKTKSQYRALMAYLSQIPTNAQGEPELQLSDDTGWIERRTLTDGDVASGSILKLVERGILLQEPRRIAKVAPAATTEDQSIQDCCHTPLLQRITACFDTHRTVLLYGEIDPCRSDVYINMIQDAAPGQSLLLLPDTYTTAPLIAALEEAFGQSMVLYHGALADNRRSAIYQRLIDAPQSVRVVVGTRSALFLPMTGLRQVIIDNESDASYRQRDPAPRYHARDVALMLAHIHGARTLIAGSVPTLESYHNAVQGKYGNIEVERRGPLPKVITLERGKGLISKYLHRQIEQRLEMGQQVVLFQNRRGFSPYVECANCGEIPRCSQCNVTLTYHKQTNSLLCHYCGTAAPFTQQCPSCGMQTLVARGIGTERVEEQIRTMFPTARVDRLDTDSAGSRVKAGRIIGQFVDQQTDILIGTQMVARTAQMGSVGLVGVINADNMLSHPDFRASERAFGTLMQLKGLVNVESDGEIVIQGSHREHTVIRAVEQSDVNGFYASELEQRNFLMYPPQVRMIRLELRHAAEPELDAAARDMFDSLSRIFGTRLSPPFEPQIDRIRNIYIRHIILRIERSRPVARAKEILAAEMLRMRKRYPKVRVVVEVDPA